MCHGKIIIVLIGGFLLLLIPLLFFAQAKFGCNPSHERLERIKQSPHYRDGEFRNLDSTPMFTPQRDRWSILKQRFFDQNNKVRPDSSLSAIHANLKDIPLSQNIVVWLGHSSLYMQIDGKRLMVDPVLSGIASPFSFAFKAFEGTDPYEVTDFPRLDYLIITHDHWDHLDYETIKQLSFQKVICPLGVGAHFERWGYNAAAIFEGDWNDSILLAPDFRIYITPSHHFSGRTFIRNKTLWCSYCIISPTSRIFISGDGGYSATFAEIGKRFGGFDLAFIECGQYNGNWRNIHLFPQETLQVACDLHARVMIPTHHSKFALSTHAWYAPLQELSRLNEVAKVAMITPQIGAVLDINHLRSFSNAWWKEHK